MRILSIALISIIINFCIATTSFADITKARNFYSFSDNVITSGQPKQALLETAAEDNIKVVINIVPETEGIYNPNEAKILEEQGIKYFHVPVNWRSPKESELQAFLDVMDSVGDQKTLVHCWANARASALVYAHRVSKAPETQEEELERLKKVWSEVAGYSLENNQTWMKFLGDNVPKQN